MTAEFDPGDFSRDIEDARQGAFVVRVIERILCNAGVPRGKTRRRDLSFDWFHAEFPEFPMRMGAAKIPNVHLIGMHQLFGAGFLKTRVFQAYQTHLLRENLDDVNDRAGLVFLWPGIGEMIIHNYPTDSAAEYVPAAGDYKVRNTRIVRPFGNPLVVYVLERLDDFLRVVGNSWADR